MKHTSPAAIGVQQSKKHTDGTENTDRSFHGFFLIYPINSLIDYMKIQRILSKLVSWLRH